jgi:hypothetical protein
MAATASATTAPDWRALSFAWIATLRASSARFDALETLAVISSSAAAVSSSEAACCSVRLDRSLALWLTSRAPLSIEPVALATAAIVSRN